MKIKEILKNNIKLYIIMATIIVLGTVGITYALMIGNFNAIAINTTSSIIDASITYDEGTNTSEVINTGNMLPISDELVTLNVVDPRVLKVKFNVSGINNNPENVIYDIAMHFDALDCELRTKDLKWRLYKDSQLLSEGSLSPTFDTIKNNRLVLTNTQEDLTNTIQRYTFLLWISEACSGDITECNSSMDQSKYLNKTLNGTIKIELSTKSKKNINRITSEEGTCNYIETDVPICNTLTYNGNNQVLVNNSDNYVAINNSGMNATEYSVTLDLNDGYKWNDGTTDKKVINCAIDKYDVEVIALNQSIKYREEISNTSAYINNSNLIEGHSLSSYKLVSSTYDVGVGTIKVNNPIITDNVGNNVTSNYNIKYKEGTVTIECLNIAKEPTVSDHIYTGLELTGVSGGEYVTIRGDKSATELGKYTVSVTPQKNYCWSDGTIIEKNIAWNILENVSIIYLDNQFAETTGTTNIYNTNNGICLDRECNSVMSTTSNKITIPSKTGYTFNGYYTGEGGTGTMMINSEGYASNDLINIKVNNNITLYAVWTANTYIVNYDANGGSGSTTSSLHTYDVSKALTSNGFSKTGYTFEGWSTTKGGSVAYNNNASVKNLTATNNGSVTLYAVWTSNTYIINASAPGSIISSTNGWTNSSDNTSSTKNIPYNSAYGTLPTSTRTGYTFAGWYLNLGKTLNITNNYWITSANGEPAATSNSYAATMDLIPVKGGITLYSNMTVCGIYTFDKNGNYIKRESSYTTVHPISQNAAYMRVELKTTDVSYETYVSDLIITEDNTFDDINNNKITSTSINSISRNHNLYPKWTANTYTVNYDANGGTGTTASSTHTYDVSKALTANGFSKTGHTFAGWSTTKGASVAYNNNASVKNLTATNNGSVTLYAVWTANKYTVNYDANGGTGTTASSSHTYDVSKALTANGFSKTGYTFAGWSTTKGGSVAHNNNSSVKNLTATNNGTVTLYAVWTANTNTAYKIEHYVMNTSGSYPTAATSTENKSGTTASSLTLANLKLTTSAYNITNGIIYSHGTVGGSTVTSTTISADGSLVIKLYYKRTYGTLTTAAGTNVSSVTTQNKVKYYYGATVSTLKATLSSSTGYTYAFSKWTSSNTTYLANKTTNPTGTFTWPAMPEGTAITLTASGTKTANTYKITYDANGGTGAPGEQSYVYSTSGTINLSSTKPSRTGYTFLGWSLSQTATTKSYDPGQAWNRNNANNYKLYAVWKINTYQVCFNANGGSGAPGCVTKTYGVTLTLPTTKPTRTGYTFLGWSTSSTATSGTWQAGGSYTTNSANTLNAVWKLTTQTVTCTSTNYSNPSNYCPSGYGYTSNTCKKTANAATYSGTTYTCVKTETYKSCVCENGARPTADDESHCQYLCNSQQKSSVSDSSYTFTYKWEKATAFGALDASYCTTYNVSTCNAAYFTTYTASQRELYRKRDCTQNALTYTYSGNITCTLK